jgi:putative membrane protein
LFQEDIGMYGMGRFAVGHGWTWLSWLGPVAMVIFWALFVTAIVMLIVHLARQARVTHGGTALAILNERYARGEIQREEFEQKKKDLGG